MKYETIIKEAKRELQKIKKYATKEEIDSLIENVNNGRFYGKRFDKCVYGSMTGNCHNSRSEELIQKCSCIYKVKSADLNVNGGKFFKHKERRNDITYFSMLEILVYENQGLVIKMIKEVFELE